MKAANKNPAIRLPNILIISGLKFGRPSPQASSITTTFQLNAAKAQITESLNALRRICGPFINKNAIAAAPQVNKDNFIVPMPKSAAGINASGSTALRCCSMAHGQPSCPGAKLKPQALSSIA